MNNDARKFAEVTTKSGHVLSSFAVESEAGKCCDRLSRGANHRPTLVSLDDLICRLDVRILNMTLRRGMSRNVDARELSRAWNVSSLLGDRYATERSR